MMCVVMKERHILLCVCVFVCWSGHGLGESIDAATCSGSIYRYMLVRHSWCRSSCSCLSVLGLQCHGASYPQSRVVVCRPTTETSA